MISRVVILLFTELALDHLCLCIQAFVIRYKRNRLDYRNTGGPRYSRTFYLRIRLFTFEK